MFHWRISHHLESVLVFNSIIFIALILLNETFPPHKILIHEKAEVLQRISILSFTSILRVSFERVMKSWIHKTSNE